ncbi:aminotransferase class IV [Streptomyces sp. NPDC001312]|uniref:aminotransferase class IV n=1 Tax=Streptomyces sp. NPDC001312 TaxID=3364561 RepID=UPI0036CDDD79
MRSLAYPPPQFPTASGGPRACGWTRCRRRRQGPSRSGELAADCCHAPPPLTAKSYTFTRDSAAVKHIGLHSQLRIRRDAHLAGFDDAVFIEPDGRVSEGGTWNLGFVDHDGTVIWPDAPVLPGTGMLLLQSLGTPKQITAPVRIDDVPNMAAAFATNTTIGVRSVCALDDVQFPQDHPVLDALSSGSFRRHSSGGRRPHPRNYRARRNPCSAFTSPPFRGGSRHFQRRQRDDA